MPKDFAGDAAFQASKGLRLSTANGTITVYERAHVKVPGLDHCVEAVLIPSSVCVLSLGLLIQDGFSFKWDPTTEHAPTMTNPEGKSIFIWCEKQTPFVSGIDYPEENAAAAIPSSSCECRQKMSFCSTEIVCCVLWKARIHQEGCMR